MSEMNIEQARQKGQEILLGLADIYNKELTPAEIMIWDQIIFTQYAPEIFSRAFASWVESSSAFFPKPGQIKELISPDKGVMHLEKAIKKGNPYEAPDLDDPVLCQAIVLMGGWEAVCKQLPDAVSDPIGHAQYVKRLEKAIGAAKTHVQVHKLAVAKLKGSSQRLLTESKQDQSPDLLPLNAKDKAKPLVEEELNNLSTRLRS